jgi:hypothetical protein
MMWIVTREINAYEQDGEYFVAAYLNKPGFAELKATIGASDVVIGKLTRGGGRHDDENTWYRLFEAVEGVDYD